MGLQECLICSETFQKDMEGKSNFSLKSQIRSVFILRKILEISPSTCSNLLLRTQNNPSTWFSCCWECYPTVIEAERIFSELTKLEIKWKKLKTSLESKVLDCIQQKTPRSQSKKHQKCEILQIIRQEAAKRLEQDTDKDRLHRGLERDSDEEVLDRDEEIFSDEAVTPNSDADQVQVKVEQDNAIELEDSETNNQFPQLDLNFQNSSSNSTLRNEGIEIFEAESNFLPSENSVSEADCHPKSVTHKLAKEKTKNLNPIVSCEECKRKFKLSYLQRHIAAVHRKESSSNSTLRNEDIEIFESSNVGDKDYRKSIEGASDQEAVAETESDFLPKLAHSAVFKLEAVKFSETSSIRQASIKFNVDRKSVREWKRKRFELEAQVEEGTPKRKRLNGAGRKVSHPELEDELEVWILQQREAKVCVTRSAIIFKAADLAAATKTSFNGSDRWVSRFLKRKGLSLRTTKEPSV